MNVLVASFLLVTVTYQFVEGDVYEPGTVEMLQPMNVMKHPFTLSGFSSGGSFAQSLMVSFSSSVDGVGVFSHTFYRCGPPNGNFTSWDLGCTILINTNQSLFYDPDQVHRDIEEYYSKGLIDNPKNLRNKRLYIYGGLRSFIFSPVQSLRIQRVFSPYIQNEYKIRTRIQDANFVMPTEGTLGPASQCQENAQKNHFIASCGFSGAYEALRFLLCDHVDIVHPSTVKDVQVQALRLFDQTVFLEGIENHQMDNVGFFYVPKRCRTGRRYPCLFHAFFHGCFNGRNFSGPSFIKNSGYLEVAEANNIIMLFPQNNPLPLLNTIAGGCWDTFGLGGPLYATQQGDQIRAVWRMISHVTGELMNYQKDVSPSKNQY